MSLTARKKLRISLACIVFLLVDERAFTTKHHHNKGSFYIIMCYYGFLFPQKYFVLFLIAKWLHSHVYQVSYKKGSPFFVVSAWERKCVGLNVIVHDISYSYTTLRKL